ncbi:MAG: hypothetical protein VX346_26330 [Planctomycetota bacterium]|nr:hypothetical protein [Planctomycetota bacterium]
MKRLLGLLLVMGTVGCGGDAPTRKPVSDDQSAQVSHAVKRAESELPEDSFRLAVQEAKSANPPKVTITITVPPAAKQIFVDWLSGPSTWSLKPSDQPVREVRFEFTGPVIVEEPEGNGWNSEVIVEVFRSGQRMTSPLSKGFGQETRPELWDAVTSIVETGLYKLGEPVVLGQLNWGGPNGEKMTLYVMDSDDEPKTLKRRKQ